jgi:hypothetical protein
VGLVGRADEGSELGGRGCDDVGEDSGTGGDNGLLVGLSSRDRGDCGLVVGGMMVAAFLGVGASCDGIEYVDSGFI